jgi:LCP family protein required for cell wall assembly
MDRGGAHAEMGEAGHMESRPRRTDRHRKARAQEIRRVDPVSTTSETHSQAEKRRRESSRMVDPRIRRMRRRRRLVVSIIVLVAILITGAVSAYGYVRNLETKINRVTNADSELAGMLQENVPPAGDPFYVLLMGSDRRPGEKWARSDTLIVARVDPKLRKVQMISIPRDTRVTIPGRRLDKINAAPSWGGPKLAIQTVKQFTGLPISYYLSVDFNGFKQVVDSIGGVWFDIKERIHDPDAPAWSRKNAVVEKGYQKLDGFHALVFVRSRHQFADGDFSRVKNQQAFLKALAQQALAFKNVFSAPAIIAAVSDNLDTNMTTTDLVTLVQQFKGLKDGDIDSATMPGTNAYIDGVSYVLPNDAKFKAMIARMREGQPLDPTKSTETSATATVGTAAGAVATPLKRSQVTLTVRNGAGVSGLAQTGADVFKNAGFVVTETGNMNQFVYSRSLVVFPKGKEAQAALVRETLGYGDVVPAAGMYAFKSDILVVIGKDWHDPTKLPVRP